MGSAIFYSKLIYLCNKLYISIPPYICVRQVYKLQSSLTYLLICGPGSSVGIATELRVGRSGDRIPVGTRFSARPARPWGPPSILYKWYCVFPGDKVRPGRAAAHSPPSSAAVMEVRSYTSTHPLGHTGPVTGSLELLLTCLHTYLLHAAESLLRS